MLNRLCAANGVMYCAQPGEEICRDLFETAREIGVPKVWGTVGPLLLDQKVKEYGLEHCGLAPDVFYPIDYWNYEWLLADLPVPSESYAIHLWNEMLNRSGWDKTLLRPENTLIGRLQRLVEGASRRK